MYHQIKNTNIKTKYKQEKHGNSGSESTIVEIKNSLDGFNTKFDLTEEKKKTHQTSREIEFMQSEKQR